MLSSPSARETALRSTRAMSAAVWSRQAAPSSWSWAARSLRSAGRSARSRSGAVGSVLSVMGGAFGECLAWVRRVTLGEGVAQSGERAAQAGAYGGGGHIEGGADLA